MPDDTLGPPLRERLIIGLSLIVVTALGWAYLAMLTSGIGHHAHDHASITAMLRPAPSGWDWPLLALAIPMWVAMMIAMMLPTAAPMIMTFARVQRRRHQDADTVVPTAIFVTAYLVVWSGFAVLAALLQSALHGTALLSSAMGPLAPMAGGVLLITAGALQFGSLKSACLNKCRTPLGFLLAQWREGRRGAFVMGLRHGAFCTGCCWALMLLMFVGGTMNLLWMAGLTIVALLEKVVPHGHAFARATGVMLIASGLWIVFTVLIHSS